MVALWVISLLLVLGSHSAVAAQPRACTDAQRASLPSIEVSPDTACAVVDAQVIGATALWREGREDEPAALNLHVVTHDGDLLFTFSDALRVSGYRSAVSRSHEFLVALRAVPGASPLQVLALSIVQRAGEDFYTGEETLVLLDVQALRVLWAGPGALEQREPHCVRQRFVSMRIHRDVLHLRSRVVRELIHTTRDEDEASCRPPMRVTVHYRLRSSSARSDARAPAE